ncbi:protein decapping 5 isoform X2 [Euphorbia lathyris]|uniref:protein decapping 5 isoform X2 n=1 Tax=Euphorbia lathyris TaxID=212925 RepID=UPI0033133800
MATDNTNNTASTSRSNSTADSYIGSLISLTSKSEIRYEGVLYNINTDESSIGLKNVRSFGTEGRKKDGPQIPPSDKVYEYILFRGSDIKDLQVKSSPPVQPAPPINNDPAIIQSHYPRPVSTSANLPPAVSGSLSDIGSHSAQIGIPGSNFQGGLPLYQPGGNLGTWGASPPPPSANGSGLAMPMYWQGYYAPNGLPQLHQQSLLRPPPGLSMPPSMQQPMQQTMQQPMQYPNYNPLPTGASNLQTSNLPASNLPVSLPDIPSPLLSASNTNLNLAPTSSSPSTLPQVPSASLASETLPSLLPNKAPSSALPAANLSVSLPTLSPLVSSGPDLMSIIPPISSKPNAIPGPTMHHQNSGQSSSSIMASNSLRAETPTPSLVTPGQLLHSGHNTIPSSQPVQTIHKDVEVVQVSSTSSTEPPVPVVTEAQPPILPLPVSSRSSHKPNGAPFHSRQGYRGRDRGRGSGSSRNVTKFTEDFDFTAMNEKFNKDEVWGHLGKSNRSLAKDKEDGMASDEDDLQDEEDDELTKPVYNKDDFFDTLSCNALDHNSQNGRPKFSEQMKIDTETFGDFPRYRGGRGGRGPPRGGGRSRGGYYGRGYGYGYGYAGRGRGRGMPNRAP